MPEPIIDRDAIIEKAKIHIYNEVEDADWGNAYDAAAAALPSIADDLLAPIEALHQEATITEFASPSCEHGGCEHGVDELTGDLECPTYPRKVCARCSSDYDWTPWPCPTAQAVAAIREAVRA